MDVSPLASDFIDEAGNGIVGFTAIYTDGTFNNITLTFNPVTQAAVQSEIIAFRQILQNSIVASPAAKPPNNEHQIKHNTPKRRLS